MAKPPHAVRLSENSQRRHCRNILSCTRPRPASWKSEPDQLPPKRPEYPFDDCWLDQRYSPSWA
eukprot:190686-Prymnesium_polylepis.2